MIDAFLCNNIEDGTRKMLNMHC